jgi:hypothetical protein
MDNKNDFINNEVWVLSIMAAFGRASVYKTDIPEIEKKYFKRKLKGDVDNLISATYNKPVSHEDHVNNIFTVMDFSEHFKDILTNGKLNFGVAQKLLNLYLKYHWCLGIIPTPPHFPVDSIIQRKLNLKVIPWTKMKNEKDYLNIIDQAKTILPDYSYKTIAELELMLFQRNQ